MNRYRVSMILATLLTSVAALNGQSLSSASLQTLREAEETTEASGGFYKDVLVQVHETFWSLSRSQFETSTTSDEQSWFTQTIDQGLAAWQKLRAMCQAQAKSDAECCQAARGVTATVKPAECCVEGIAGVCKNLVVPSQGVRTGSLMLGGGVRVWRGAGTESCVDKCPLMSSGYRVFIVPVELTPSSCGKGTATPLMDDLVRQYRATGSWNLSCWGGDGACIVLPAPDGHYRDIKSFIQFLPAPHKSSVSVPACNCAKACACCEMCKASKAAQVQPMLVPVGPQTWTLPCPPQVTWTLPAPPPHAAREIVQIAPQSARPAPPPVWTGPHPTPMVPGMPMSYPMPARAKHAHFVTPDFDAHCERMTHRGDTVILEGNVVLLCKKHAQPIRVEGQRIVVNMKDGSFNVESEAPAPADVKLRRNAVEHPHRYEVEMYMPVRGTPPQCLESAYPPMHPGQRIIQVMPVPPQEALPPVERPR